MESTPKSATTSWATKPSNPPLPTSSSSLALSPPRSSTAHLVSSFPHSSSLLQGSSWPFPSTQKGPPSLTGSIKIPLSSELEKNGPSSKNRGKLLLKLRRITIVYKLNRYARYWPNRKIVKRKFGPRTRYLNLAYAESVPARRRGTWNAPEWTGKRLSI